MTQGARLMRGFQLAAVAAVVLVSAESMAIERRSPGYSPVGRSAGLAALELAVGVALTCCGAVALDRRGQRGFGSLLVCAGFTWFLQEWDNPGADSAVAFTVGLLFSTVCPVLIAHAALIFSGHGLSRLENVAVLAAYASTVGVAGSLNAAFADPQAGGCSACPADLVAVGTGNDSFLATSESVGVGWAVVLVLLLCLRVVNSSPPQRRMTGPLDLVTVSYLGAVTVHYLHLTRRNHGIDGTARLLWVVQAGLLLAVAMSTSWPAVRGRMVRARVARLVVELARLTPTGGLGGSLGAMLRDDGLRLLYPLSDGRLTDGAGQPVQVTDGQVTTNLTQGERVVAVLAHRPGLLDEPGVVVEIASAAGLVLDNERLQAEERAQLADLRASRRRIVAAADHTRRQLERDLHDGAQQKLVVLSLGLRLASLQAADGVDRATCERLDAAQAEATVALQELRVLARGLYPRELADEGLAAGLQTLAETSSTPIYLTGLIEDRLPVAVESAAFFVVARAVRGSRWASVHTSMRGTRLVVETRVDAPLEHAVDIEDRVGALEGTVSVEPDGRGGSRVHVVLPCA